MSLVGSKFVDMQFSTECVVIDVDDGGVSIQYLDKSEAYIPWTEWDTLRRLGEMKELR